MADVRVDWVGKAIEPYVEIRVMISPQPTGPFRAGPEQAGTSDLSVRRGAGPGGPPHLSNTAQSDLLITLD